MSILFGTHRARSFAWIIIVPLLVEAAGDAGRAETEDTGPLIIFDTDFRADCDDVGALAVLHKMADADECEILGIVTSTTGPKIVPAIDAVNTYYGRPDLPIGLCPTPHTEHFDPTPHLLATLPTILAIRRTEPLPTVWRSIASCFIRHPASESRS